jgi:hypothetical protein
MQHDLQQGIHISKEDVDTACYLTHITPVGTNFLSDVTLIDFHWEEVYNLEWVYKMFVSKSV